MLITCTCPLCFNHWQYLRIEGIGFCIRLAENECDDPDLLWGGGATKLRCPKCIGLSPERGAYLSVSDLLWMGFSGQTGGAIFMDAVTT